MGYLMEEQSSSQIEDSSTNAIQLLMWSRIKCLRLNEIKNPGCSRGKNVDNITGPADLELLPLDTFIQEKYAWREENMSLKDEKNDSETQ